MSLDVYLKVPSTNSVPVGERIYIRADGRNLEISREEWSRRFPDRAPVIIPASFEDVDDELTVFDGNITHNLGNMAEAAGLYKPMWTPEEIGITKADQLIEPLTDGLVRLVSDPERYKNLNPSNGWGTYDGLVEFTRDYLEACIRYPDATVNTWR